MPVTIRLTSCHSRTMTGHTDPGTDTGKERMAEKGLCTNVTIALQCHYRGSAPRISSRSKRVMRKCLLGNHPGRATEGASAKKTLRSPAIIQPHESRK